MLYADDHIKIGGKGQTGEGKIDWSDAIKDELFKNKDSVIYSECESFDELNLYVLRAGSQLK